MKCKFRGQNSIGWRGGLLHFSLRDFQLAWNLGYIYIYSIVDTKHNDVHFCIINGLLLFFFLLPISSPLNRLIALLERKKKHIQTCSYVLLIRVRVLYYQEMQNELGGSIQENERWWPNRIVASICKS